MNTQAPAAITVVRGFQATPVASADEDSDYNSGLDTPRFKSAQRGRTHRIDDVISANCSPTLRPAASPSMSGIAKLRLQMDPLSLDGASRSSSMSRNGSNQGKNARYYKGMANSRSHSSDGARSDTGSEGSESYEVNLEHDFVSESVRDRNGFLDQFEGGLNLNRKMTTEDFETLRCLGKGTY